MSKEILLPDIGSDAVEVVEISVAVGDMVEADQPLLTVEGDKASMEVPSPEAGKVASIEIAVGDSVTTGTLIMRFDTAGAADAPAAEAPAAEAAPAAAAATSEQAVAVPDIGGDAVEVTEILVQVGDSVEAEQSLITVEGDKASMEVPAPVAGVVKSIDIKVGDTVNTGSHIMTFEVSGGTPAASAPAKAEAAPAPAAPAAAPAPAATPAPATEASSEFEVNDAYIYASPAIRRLAREFGVNLTKVEGRGRKGRIQKEDVQRYVKEMLKRAESGAAGGGSNMGFDLLPWPKVDFSQFGEVEEVELSRIQKISGPNLHRNWVRIPHVTQFDEANISELEAFRKQQNQLAAKRDDGIKITPLAFIMKAVAYALKQHPRFCSSLSEDGKRLTMKKYVHIGVAVDTPNGLVVPVFRDVDQKGIHQLSQELAEVSAKARKGQLTSSDMQGSCFTISSLGGIGGTQFTPIVNAPDVAILGVSKSEMKPKWNGKEFEPQLMLPLALSYDHRVIDGAAGARFITTLSGILSDIRNLVL
ncbi:pyruvate dehydrogenase complex dihydrolipoyllysine-residue acetyltransferase [Dongshaea marina]|uniref:pyruvate dehydrogenase complex dihydrolipoyllysine-residue acetyltransferase n=1 Tax=Dongshaea marina TaxID=2047966 RepID=UPI000D3E9110|nr:pyruvate dehydrogenase complex dihydrolipoyllysine-residue acetyltransferase [Dongshaea marina]